MNGHYLFLLFILFSFILSLSLHFSPFSFATVMRLYSPRSHFEFGALRAYFSAWV